MYCWLCVIFWAHKPRKQCIDDFFLKCYSTMSFQKGNKLKITNLQKENMLNFFFVSFWAPTVSKTETLQHLEK